MRGKEGRNIRRKVGEGEGRMRVEEGRRLEEKRGWTKEGWRRSWEGRTRGKEGSCGGRGSYWWRWLGTDDTGTEVIHRVGLGWLQTKLVRRDYSAKEGKATVVRDCSRRVAVRTECGQKGSLKLQQGVRTSVRRQEGGWLDCDQQSSVSRQEGGWLDCDHRTGVVPLK